MQKSNVIDIDERAGSFEPVVVKFRGEEYMLGGTAASLVSAAGVYTSTPREEGESDTAFSLRLVRPMLVALNPGIAEELKHHALSAMEELAFMPVLTEVMKRVSALKFRASED